MEKLFRKAAPVWAAGKEEEMNYFLSAKATAEYFRGRAVVRIACCTAYHLTVNGIFAGYGPARCGEGFFRFSTFGSPADTAEAAGRLAELLGKK